LGILAFDATRLCAANVDFPIDLLLYTRQSFELIEHRFERKDLVQISDWWQERMRRAVNELPSEWVESVLKACGEKSARLRLRERYATGITSTSTCSLCLAPPRRTP
jgi:putative proteasome-type protease